MGTEAQAEENIDGRVVCLYRPYDPKVVLYLDHLFICPGPHHAIGPEV